MNGALVQLGYRVDGDVPDKTEGEHRWMAVSAHAVTGSQAAAMSGGAHVRLDDANRIGMSVGCTDCGGDFAEVRLSPCPGAPVVL